MSCYLQIADIKIVLKLIHDIVINDSFLPFVIENSDDAYIVDFQQTQYIPRSDEKNKIFSNMVCSVYLDNDCYIRVFHDHKENDERYAYMYDDQQGSHIYYVSQFQSAFSETLNTFSHIGFENILMKYNAFILHSSCLNYHDKGILFTGPSGIGKSTQASLWEKYENAKLINGDRTIIRYLDKWYGYGSPYAGSSKCFKNERVEINCIVILEQGHTNTIKRLKSIEAFKMIYSQMIVNSWDKLFVDKIINFINELINNVSIYYLSCTPDQRAVELLKSMIERDS